MAAMKLEKQSGNFELGSSGPHASSYVAVASGEGAFRVGSSSCPPSERTLSPPLRNSSTVSWPGTYTHVSTHETYLDPAILNKVKGLTWETNMFSMPSNVLLRAYDYYDVEGKMYVGFSNELWQKLHNPVWCRVAYGPEARMPEGVLLKAFNAFDRYKKEITYVVGTAEELRNLPCTVASPSPAIWVWDYTAIGRMQMEGAA